VVLSLLPVNFWKEIRLHLKENSVNPTDMSEKLYRNESLSTRKLMMIGETA
jgi:hypothetical protein